MVLVIDMNIVGTICEYNPFHNGHLYLLKKIKEIEKPDLLVVCLSTYFTMRGDLSLHSPKTKTNYALNEADLVIGLPSVLACNSATYFANNAVKELNKVKVNKIYCGSEGANLEKLKSLNIENLDKKNKSYKKATQDILNIKSNDILAYSYYNAIKNNGYNIELNLIKRIGDMHNTLEPKDDYYTSSTAIRNNHQLFTKYTPNYVTKDNLLDYEKLFPYFKFNMLNNSFNNLSFISDGIDKHIKNKILASNSFKELLEKTTNSYFTTTKIKRAIFYLLFNIYKYDNNYPYLKVLGFNNKGKDYLNFIKKDLDIITNNKEGICDILDYEIKIATILDFIFNTNLKKEELSPPIIKDC